MKVFVIDSLTSNKNYTSVNFTNNKPTSDYIDHADDVLSILKRYCEPTFAHVTEDSEEDPYVSRKNHEYFNKALEYAIRDGSFDAIYAGLSFYIYDAESRKLAEKTNELINKLKIPVVCPAENNKAERDKYKDALYLSPSGDNPAVKYICSVKNSWPGCTAFKGTQGSEKRKKEEYSSRLAAMYIVKLLNC